MIWRADREDNLRILGVPEGDEGPRPTEFIATLLQEVLELEEKPLLDRAHRSLRPKPKSGKAPWAFVIRVHYYHVRDQILRRAAVASPLTCKGSKLSIFPDFTVEVVKKILHEHPSIKFGLFFPAELKITMPSGEILKFTDPDVAMTFVNTKVCELAE